jgi:hypothetical protein
MSSKGFQRRGDTPSHLVGFGGGHKIGHSRLAIRLTLPSNAATASPTRDRSPRIVKFLLIVLLSLVLGFAPGEGRGPQIKGVGPSPTVSLRIGWIFAKNIFQFCDLFCGTPLQICSRDLRILFDLMCERSHGNLDNGGSRSRIDGMMLS